MSQTKANPGSAASGEAQQRERRPVVSLIAAMARNRVIGKDGGLPWRIPEDMRFFKRMTSGHPVIMGRRTYETDSGLLPNRENIILTTKDDYDVAGATVCASLDEALERFAATDEEVFIIGGSEVYRAALPRADRIYLTVIEREYEGDTYFPEFDASRFEEVSREMFEDPEPYYRVLLERVNRD